MNGLPTNVGIQTASLYGRVNLDLTTDISRNNLGNTVQIKYLVSTGQIQLIKTGSNPTTITFSPSELDSTNSSSTLALYQRGQVTIPFSNDTLPKEVFELHIPVITGVPLSYTRFGTYANLNVSILAQNINPLAVFVFGQPTTNMPLTGTASFRTDLFGAVVEKGGTVPSFYTLGDGHGSATFSANFGSGTVATSISLAADGKDFGVVSGNGTIVSGGPAFSGSLAGTATGGYTGAFFGPSAVEMGYVFNVANGTNWLAYGNVFGTTAPPPP